MPSTSIACGTLLVIIGFLGFFNSIYSDNRSWTALIPSLFGIVLILLGVLARMKDNLRKHLMHAAVVVALLGFIAVSAQLFRKFDSLTYSAATVSQVSMALVCLLFVILAIKSFADARRRNESI